MGDALEHRGPDDYGFAAVTDRGIETWREQPPREPPIAEVAFGHRRLSILDLTTAGRQPFVSPDGRMCMVYNGEIYNYKELRDELRPAGHEFRTQTDTEVLLAAFRHWGTGCFERFNGMWSVLIWDRQARTLVASRDRFGIKPLYYQHCPDGRWLFGSEIGALLSDPGAHRAPDTNAVLAQLVAGIWPEGGSTFFDGVQQVEPGTCMAFSPSGVTSTRYWQLPEPDGDVMRDEREASARLQHLLEDSVRLRLRSDVRVGTMLSGGVDSTSIVHSMVQMSRRGEADSQSLGDSVQAITATFPGEQIDESADVVDYCGHLGLTLHKVAPLEVPAPEELFVEAIRLMEVPMNLPAPMINVQLMRRAREIGVTVTLDGHGSDEIFAGYPSPYCYLRTADSLRGFRPCDALREGLAVGPVHGMGHRLALRGILQELLERDIRYVTPLGTALLEQRDGERAVDVRRFAAQAGQWRRQAGRSALDRRLRHDLLNKVVPRWLHVEDRTSMSASIEARVPFLDYRIVEFAFRIADSLKINRGRTKHVLRNAMQDRVPDFILWNMAKRTFPRPDALWLRNGLAGALGTYLLPRDARVRELIPGKVLDEWVRSFQAGNGALAQDVWLLLATEIWLREFFG
jgi:asparagine synthase (glutamine-hydrolysing)